MGKKLLKGDARTGSSSAKLDKLKTKARGYRDSAASLRKGKEDLGKQPVFAQMMGARDLKAAGRKDRLGGIYEKGARRYEGKIRSAKVKNLKRIAKGSVAAGVAGAAAYGAKKMNDKKKDS